MSNLYLYLVRTDNRRVKILSIFRNQPTYPATQITDITILHLPQTFTDTLNRTISQYQTRWNTWIETADNADGLKTSLAKRQITGLYFMTPLCPFEYDANYSSSLPNLKIVKPQYKTMVQKITFS